ncbi:MAG: hypothetical protein ACTSUE_21785 [Promethearchaeota archaeon]
MGMPILPAIGDDLKKNEREITKTVLVCKTCKEEKIREYKEGDIVFQDAAADESCEKCTGPLMINQIYVEIIKKKK